MNQLIACCGLDCEKCDARIATVTNDSALRAKTAALWTRLNGVPITPEMIHCTGCRIGGIKTPFCDRLSADRPAVSERAVRPVRRRGYERHRPDLPGVGSQVPFRRAAADQRAGVLEARAAGLSAVLCGVSK